MGAVAPWRKNSLKNCSFEGYVKGAKYSGEIAAVGHKISNCYVDAFLGYFPDIVQAFDTLGRNVYGDD